MIVAVTRDHMPCAADVDVIRVWHEFKKLFGMRLLDELGRCTAHKQRGNLDPPRGVDQ